ncbi:hypothetical protein CRI94_17320 [Longibacter salinarum]|uniref:Uncharacterized protein n=1 Tax=Longibacter salinarum TaxID=1850348 RepID=A0A2A8CT61_9BACT|nr:hypothetical protein [Longibacter salinarum]PEN10377.1 hypothetical protein CRI94_17320 [Longibacter salinarum]
MSDQLSCQPQICVYEGTDRLSGGGAPEGVLIVAGNGLYSYRNGSWQPVGTSTQVVAHARMGQFDLAGIPEDLDVVYQGDWTISGDDLVAPAGVTVTPGDFAVSVTKGRFPGASFDGINYQSDRITINRTRDSSDQAELFVTVRRFL